MFNSSCFVNYMKEATVSCQILCKHLSTEPNEDWMNLENNHYGHFETRLNEQTKYLYFLK